jgi:hypothetical protein
MNRSNATRAVAVLAALALSSSALAKGHDRGVDSTASTSTTKASKNNPVADTITWWCVDLNDLWNAKETVVVGAGGLIGDGTGPCAGTTPFPVVVPAGQTFMPGGTFNWTTNKTYPAGYAEAIAAQGFTFAPASNSPSEDFKQKMSQIRVEVFTFPEGDPVAAFTFDPQKNFKLVQLRDFAGTTLPDYATPGFSLDELGRLPTYGFPVSAGPVPPGQYSYCVFWSLSGDHWDGIGTDPNANFLPSGEFLYGCNRFGVAS